jgi:hypothetical protein
LTKTREAKVVDLAAQGTSQGDMRVLNAPLYNESAKEKVGHFDVFCVLTNPDEKVEITQCVAMYALSDGEISTQGVTAYPKLSKIPSRVVDAVSGDTGATLVCGAS